MNSELNTLAKELLTVYVDDPKLVWDIAQEQGVDCVTAMKMKRDLVTALWARLREALQDATVSGLEWGSKYPEDRDNLFINGIAVGRIWMDFDCKEKPALWGWELGIGHMAPMNLVASEAEARTALEQAAKEWLGGVASPATVSVPAGWKLVPVEATEEMCKTGADYKCWPDADPIGPTAKYVYAAMLSASPAPPKEE